MRVLIVEDQVGDQPLLVSELQARGHEVERCQEPLAAWSAYQEHPYPLVLIGVTADSSKSLQLLRQLRVAEAARRAQTPRTTAIAL
ncbi:MAG: response regulator, partial [Spirulinaceae cyanobacterium RM2_2_10]|nr:response regulator [Spirulinaceae cyanobacterium RM2_2_10]